MHILQTVNQKMSWLERPQSKHQKPGKSRNIVKAPPLNYQHPFCLQEWRHSMIVVASMKYPPHSTHMRCGLSSVIFILVVRCILAERWERGRGKTCTERKEKKRWNGRKPRPCLERTWVCLASLRQLSSFMLTQRQTNVADLQSAATWNSE